MSTGMPDVGADPQDEERHRPSSIPSLPVTQQIAAPPDTRKPELQAHEDSQIQKMLAGDGQLDPETNDNNEIDNIVNRKRVGIEDDLEGMMTKKPRRSNEFEPIPGTPEPFLGSPDRMTPEKHPNADVSGTPPPEFKFDGGFGSFDFGLSPVKPMARPAPRKFQRPGAVKNPSRSFLQKASQSEVQKTVGRENTGIIETPSVRINTGNNDMFSLLFFTVFVFFGVFGLIRCWQRGSKVGGILIQKQNVKKSEIGTGNVNENGEDEGIIGDIV